MPISARQASTTPRSRVVVASVLGAIFVALIASGRIVLDELLGYGLLVTSIMLAGMVTAALTRRQVAPGEQSLVPAVSTRIDPLGTFIVPALLVLGGIGFFGWLRPLPSLPIHRPGRNGLLLRSLATPVTHLAIVVGAVVVFRLTFHGVNTVGLAWIPRVAFLAGFVNVWLLVVSLVPVPPLPGSVVLERLLPVRAWSHYARIRPYLLKGAVGALLVSIMLGLGLTTLVQHAIARWWISLCAL